jgi:hypothetical protein
MKNSLLRTNTWLQNAAGRGAALRRTAATSSAIEGIVKPFSTKTQSKISAAHSRVKSARARA